MKINVTSALLPSLDSLMPMMEEIWNSGFVTNNGPKHNLLEKSLKEYLGVENISLFGNGTLALMIAIKALDLKGEIITTPFTFPATPHSISWFGIKPVFCDINPDTMCIDVDKIESLITKDTSAIMPVHVYGNVCDVEKIDRIAKKYNLKVIYDAAHAFGAEVDGVPIGRFGDASMFSFHATKLFNTIEGGCLTFNDPLLKQKSDLLKNFGIKNEEEIVDIGINSKLNEIQSMIGLLNLELISEERKKRSKIKKIYDKNLSNISGIVINQHLPEVPSLQYYPIKIKKDLFGIDRNQLHAELKELGINARKYFYPLLSNIDAYKDLPSSSKSHLPVSNRVVTEVLCLPFHGKIEAFEAEAICDKISLLARSKI